MRELVSLVWYRIVLVTSKRLYTTLQSVVDIRHPYSALYYHTSIAFL